MLTTINLAAFAAILIAQPSAAQVDNPSGTVFAVLDRNEWCPGGSVYLDLRTGAYLLYPRLHRPRCTDPAARIEVKRGAIDAEQRSRVVAAYRQARRFGLRKDNCDIIISNGGPEALVITAPAFSEVTPEEDGCWSDEARTLHEELFRIFDRVEAR